MDVGGSPGFTDVRRSGSCATALDVSRSPEVRDVAVREVLGVGCGIIATHGTGAALGTEPGGL